MPEIDTTKKIALVVNGDTDPSTMELHQENVETSTAALLENDYEIFVVSSARPEGISEDHYLPIGKDNVAKMFETISGRLDGNDLFVMYTTGHGDTTGPVIGDDILPIASLKQYLDALPSHQHISFDTCYGGTFVNKLKAPKRFLVANTPKEHTGYCKFQARAYWSPEHEKARDENSDRVVTFEERALHAQRVSSEQTGHYAFTIYKGEEFNDRGLSAANGRHAAVELVDITAYHDLTANAKVPVIMIVGDTDCPACRKMEESLPKVLAGVKTDNIKIFKTNCQDIGAELGVTVVPAVLFKWPGGDAWTRAPIASPDEVGTWIKRVADANHEKRSLEEIKKGLSKKKDGAFLDDAVRYAALQQQSKELLIPEGELKGLLSSADLKDAAILVEMLSAVPACTTFLKNTIADMLCLQCVKAPDVERIKAFLKAISAGGEIDDFKWAIDVMVRSANTDMAIASLEFMNYDNLERYALLSNDPRGRVRREFVIKKMLLLFASAERESFVMGFVNDTDEGVREAAISGLIGSYDDGAFKTLVNALKDASVAVRRSAAWALSKTYVDDERRKMIWDVTKNSDDIAVIYKTLPVLRSSSGHVQSAVRTQVTSWLKEKISSAKDENEKAVFYYELHRFGGNVDTKVLKDIFFNAQGNEEKILAALILAEKGDEKAARFLCQVASTTDSAERFSEVLETLAKIDSGEVRKTFIGRFNDKELNLNAKDAVMEEVSRYPPEELAKLDKKLLKQYARIYFRMGMFAGGGLGRVPDIIVRQGDAEMIGYLMEQCGYLIDKDPFIVARVLGALSRSPDHGHKDFIVKMIREHPFDVLLDISSYHQDSPYIDEYVMTITTAIYFRYDEMIRHVADRLLRDLYESAKSPAAKEHVLKYMNALGISLEE